MKLPELEELFKEHGVNTYKIIDHTDFTGVRYHIFTDIPIGSMLQKVIRSKFSSNWMFTFGLLADPDQLEFNLPNLVSHPPHYNSGKFEVIEVIEDWNLNFHKGNAVKYMARAGKKDASKEIEDLEKAVWYLNREIECLKALKETRDKVRPNNMVKR